MTTTEIVITEDALRAVLYAHGLMEKEVLDVLAELGVKSSSEEGADRG